MKCSVESEHNRLKKALGSTTCTFDTVFKKANEIMNIQIINIKESMEQSRTRVPVDMRTSNLYQDITGRVSRACLQLIRGEVSTLRYGVLVDASACGCYYRRTHGIPCRHELSETLVAGRSISLSSIHDFWKKLDIEFDNNLLGPNINNHEFQEIWEALQKAPAPLQRQLFRTISEGLNPESMDVSAPDHLSDANQPRTSSNTRILSDWENNARYFGVPTKSPSSSSSKKSRFSAVAATQSSLMFYGSNSLSTPSLKQHKSNVKGSPSSPSTPTSVVAVGASSTPTSLPPPEPSGRGRGRAGAGRGRGRGRGRGPRIVSLDTSSNSGDFTPFIIPFVQGFTDVIGDGNCGYRAVALHVYGNQNEWTTMRKKCCLELNNRRELYQAIMPWKDMTVLYNSIAWFGSGLAPHLHWMTLPCIIQLK